MLNNNLRSIKEILFENRKIDSITGCWLWTGSAQRGYGQVHINGKNFRVHRLSYEEFIGPLTQLCLHKTTCPNKRCFNPEHLYEGDDFQNMQDMATINHPKLSKTHCRNGHEYTPENTYRCGMKKDCKICMKARDIIGNEKKRLKRLEQQARKSSTGVGIKEVF